MQIRETGLVVMPSIEIKHASSQMIIQVWKEKNKNMLLSQPGTKLSEIVRQHLEVWD